MSEKMRNIGPKSAAWLRQVGLRTLDDIAAIGAVEAYMKVRRAGFKCSMNLLFSLEGALQDCHWNELPEARRLELQQAVEAAITQLPPPRGRPAASPVTTTRHDDEAGAAPAFGLFDDDRHAGAESASDD
ncbi:MAG: TfoX/Sxy family protein [Thermomonas sp.]|uniref:TfoX/Sxy family protein n=1 Tax=Thermomonas sp. TaxID=1971895 RepID=UPI0039E274EC